MICITHVLQYCQKNFFNKTVIIYTNVNYILVTPKDIIRINQSVGFNTHSLLMSIIRLCVKEKDQQDVINRIYQFGSIPFGKYDVIKITGNKQLEIHKTNFITIPDNASAQANKAYTMTELDTIVKQQQPPQPKIDGEFMVTGDSLLFLISLLMVAFLSYTSENNQFKGEVGLNFVESIINEITNLDTDNSFQESSKLVIFISRFITRFIAQKGKKLSPLASENLFIRMFAQNITEKEVGGHTKFDTIHEDIIDVSKAIQSLPVNATNQAYDQKNVLLEKVIARIKGSFGDKTEIHLNAFSFQSYADLNDMSMNEQYDLIYDMKNILQLLSQNKYMNVSSYIQSGLPFSLINSTYYVNDMALNSLDSANKLITDNFNIKMHDLYLDNNSIGNANTQKFNILLCLVDRLKSIVLSLCDVITKKTDNDLDNDIKGAIGSINEIFGEVKPENWIDEENNLLILKDNKLDDKLIDHMIAINDESDQTICLLNIYIRFFLLHYYILQITIASGIDNIFQDYASKLDIDVRNFFEPSLEPLGAIYDNVFDKHEVNDADVEDITFPCKKALSTLENNKYILKDRFIERSGLRYLWHNIFWGSIHGMTKHYLITGTAIGLIYYFSNKIPLCWNYIQNYMQNIIFVKNNKKTQGVKNETTPSPNHVSTVKTKEADAPTV